MVRALKEIWRVLTVEGGVIDLRPLAGQSRVEVVDGEQLFFAGLVDESGDVADDIAADNALAQIVNEGQFIQMRQIFFDYAMYWNTPHEMKRYAQERWQKSYLPDIVLTKVQGFLAHSSTAAKVRIRRKMMITKYQKRIQYEKLCFRPPRF